MTFTILGPILLYPKILDNTFHYANKLNLVFQIVKPIICEKPHSDNAACPHPDNALSSYPLQSYHF